MDQSFIKRIISRIKDNSIYDYEIKDCFTYYVQTLLDLALSDEDYLNTDDDEYFYSGENLIVKQLAAK